jgi:O-antigen/teichoic acid export membrane protein
VVDLLIAQAVPLISSFAVTVCTARLLGPSGRGTLAFTVSAAGLLGVLLQASLYIGAVHGYRQKDVDALSVGLVVTGALTAVAVALAFGQLLLPSYRIGLVTSRETLAVVCGAAATGVTWYLTRVLQALGHAREYRNAILLQSLAYLLLGVSAAILWRRPGPVIVVWIVTLVVSTVAAAGHLRPYLRGFVRCVRLENSGLWRSILRSSLSAHVGLAGQMMLFRTDVVVLGLLAPPYQVGVYSIAVALAELVSRASEAFSMAAFDEGEQALSPNARKERRQRLLSLYFQITAGLTVVIVVGTILLLPRVLPGYRATIPLVLVLLPGICASGCARITLASIVASNARRPALAAGVVAMALSLLYPPAIMAWQATGAAAASSIVYGAQWAYCQLLVRRLDRAADGVPLTS